MGLPFFREPQKSLQVSSFPRCTVVKNLPADAGDTRDAGSILGSGRSPGVGNGNPLQLFLPGKSHGQRSLENYSSWNQKRVRHNWVTVHTHTHTHTHHTAPHTNVPCSSGVRWRIESVLNSATTWQREAVAAKIQVKWKLKGTVYGAWQPSTWRQCVCGEDA